MDALISALPILIILACPLMMIFMMRGMHGGHGDGDQQGHTHDQHERIRPDVAREERIAELEREVAALRDQSRDRDDVRVGRS